MLDHLQTEARNLASANLDELSPRELVRLMNAEDAHVSTAVAAEEDAIVRAIEVVTDRLRHDGRLIYVGAGTSGRLGVLDATECPPTFNAPPGQVVGVIAGGPTALTRAVEGAEDKPELGEQDLKALNLSAKDVVVGIATSGRTPYVLGAVAYAGRLGAFTIGLSCNQPSELAAAADLAISPVVGAEVLSGSTRLKAGTATKMVLNMLSTGAMVGLGKTFGNLMVDLRATNTKLRARTNRIVRILTGLDVEQAGELLGRCDGELKTALVAYRAGVSAEEARQRLERAGGQVRAALETTSGVAAQTEPGLILGIDGGGTSTVALLAQVDESGGEWTILGRGAAGPSNRHAVGSARALRALNEAVSAAFAAAKRPRATVAAACLGLAGADRAEDRAALNAWANEVRLAARVEITNDAALLLAAGTPDGWGVALIAGTGSIAFGRGPDGRTARVGGWGYLLGDEGSGYALTTAALQAVVRAADGRGEATRLTECFLEQWDLKEPQDLILTIYDGNLDRAALAALAPLVLETAEAKDAVAEQLVTTAAGQLANMASLVARRLGFDRANWPLALAGGVLLGSASYRDRMVRALSAGATPVTLVAEPAAGALRLARERTGTNRHAAEGFAPAADGSDTRAPRA